MGFNGDLYPTAGASSVLSTKGDIVRYNTERERYGIGSAGQVLQVASSLPTWSTINLADSVLTTAGDVLYENATPELARLPKGNLNDVLTMGASLPAWTAPAGGGGAYSLIETVTQPSDATDITSTFSAVTFPDTLYVTFYGKYDDSQDLGIICNGITGTWDVNGYLWNTSSASKRTTTGEAKGEFVNNNAVNNEEAWGWATMGINPLTQLIQGSASGGGNIGWGVAGNRCTTASQTTLTSVTLTGTTTNIRQNSVMSVYKLSGS